MGGFKEELTRSGALAAIQRQQKQNSKIQLHSKNMQCYSLNELIRKANLEHEIILFSADCEGCEYEVFQSLAWESFSPVVILTEKAQDINRLCNVVNLLTKKGYSVINYASSDVIYLRNDFVSKYFLYQGLKF